MKCCALALLAFAASVGSVGAASPAESDRTQIAALEQRWLAAIRSGDRQALGEILADGFVDINTNGQMRDRDDAIAHASAPPDTAQIISQLQVRVFGDTAIVNGINTVHSKKLGWKVEVAFTDVFMREHGAWRAVSAQETLRKLPAVSPATH